MILSRKVSKQVGGQSIGSPYGEQTKMRFCNSPVLVHTARNPQHTHLQEASPDIPLQT